MGRRAKFCTIKDDPPIRPIASLGPKLIFGGLSKTVFVPAFVPSFSGVAAFTPGDLHRAVGQTTGYFGVVPRFVSARGGTRAKLSRREYRPFWPV